MLVFTRRPGETIMIGDGIEVEILRIGVDSVRIGITAPSDVAVHRREVYDQIRAANATAVTDVSALDDVVAKLRSNPPAPPDSE